MAAAATSTGVVNRFFGVEHTIGAKCSECGLVDYLPYKCQGCGKPFCAEHRKDDAHDCTAAKAKDGRVCEAADDDLEEVRVRTSTSRAETAHRRKAEGFYKCRHKGCRTRSPIRCLCPKCNKNFCVAHRLTDMHICTPVAEQPQNISTRVPENRRVTHTRVDTYLV